MTSPPRGRSVNAGGLLIPATTTETLGFTPDDTLARQTAKMRIYVLLQTLGWGVFLALQISSVYFFSDKAARRDTTLVTCSVGMVVAMGLLLTHYSRVPMARWRWKELGWRGLFPRILGLSFVLSAAWSLLGYGYTYQVLRYPWDSKYGLGAVMLISLINGTVLLFGWYCVYYFYHLFDRFNRLEIERLRLVTTVKESELRALKSQINPHFIFNSLNSLRALIDEDPRRARQAVTQLAHLLRYSLQSGQLETVPFESELAVVNDYLALEQVRHEERLRLRLDVAPETLALQIPPMLLQTLVENAVKYGIATRPEGGEVAIVARCDGHALRLQVFNPGSLDTPTEALASRPTSTGLGLRNAADRLKLLFGERATLELRADAPGMVVAEAIIPLSKA